jgi:hypothetical protein
METLFDLFTSVTVASGVAASASTSKLAWTVLDTGSAVHARRADAHGRYDFAMSACIAERTYACDGLRSDATVACGAILTRHADQTSVYGQLAVSAIIVSGITKALIGVY